MKKHTKVRWNQKIQQYEYFDIEQEKWVSLNKDSIDVECNCKGGCKKIGKCKCEKELC